jgi:putative MATE family efflux protein
MPENPSGTQRSALVSGPITKSLLRLAWPVMLSNLFHTLYNLVDTLWLGRLGTAHVAAPGISWPVIFMGISIGAGATIAGTALVAQYTGAGRPREADRAAGQVFAFTGLLALVLATLGAGAAHWILRVMGAGPELLPLATTYMRTVMAGIPAVFGLFVANALLTGIGDTITPMRLMAVSTAINVLLDWLLIFGIGPFPAMGVFGAAVATISSQGLVAAFAFYLLFSGRLRVRLHWRDLRLRWATVRQIVAIGGPASFGQAGTALGFTIMTGILARFGTPVVSAFTIGNRIISIVLMPAMGLGQATATMVGQNLGAEQPSRAGRSAWVGMAISTAILLTASILVYVFRADVVRVFLDDPEVIAIGAQMFALTAMAFPFMGILQVCIGTYQGSGHTVYSMLFALFRLWGLRIPLVWYLGMARGMGPDGVWWAMFASNFGASIVSLATFLTGNWKHRVIKEAPLPVEPAPPEMVELEAPVERPTRLQP